MSTLKFPEKPQAWTDEKFVAFINDMLGFFTVEQRVRELSQKRAQQLEEITKIEKELAILAKIDVPDAIAKAEKSRLAYTPPVKPPDAIRPPPAAAPVVSVVTTEEAKTADQKN